MDTREILRIKYARDRLLDRRAALVESAQRLVDDARNHTRELNLRISDLDGQEIAPANEHSREEGSPWVVVHRDGDRVICGKIEIENYIDDGAEHFFNGNVAVLFVSGSITEDKESADEVLTVGGELLVYDYDEIVYECCPAIDITIVLAMPNATHAEFADYPAQIEKAEEYQASFASSLQTIVDAANDPGLNPTIRQLKEDTVFTHSATVPFITKG